jgi:hypothetical protein
MKKYITIVSVLAIAVLIGYTATTKLLTQVDVKNFVAQASVPAGSGTKKSPCLDCAILYSTYRGAIMAYAQVALENETSYTSEEKALEIKLRGDANTALKNFQKCNDVNDKLNRTNPKPNPLCEIYPKYTKERTPKPKLGDSDYCEQSLQKMISAAASFHRAGDSGSGARKYDALNTYERAKKVYDKCANDSRIFNEGVQRGRVR